MKNTLPQNLVGRRRSGRSIKALIPSVSDLRSVKEVVAVSGKKKTGASASKLVSESNSIEVSSEESSRAPHWKNPVECVKAAGLGTAIGLWYCDKKSVENNVFLLGMMTVTGVTVRKCRTVISENAIAFGNWIKP